MTAPGVDDGVRGALPERAVVTERRLHPVTPFRRAWAPVAVIVGWAAHDPNQTQEQLTRLTTTTLLIALAVIVPSAALYGFLSWWFTHFAVTDAEMRIRTGLLFRRTAHIRLERIQAVDVTQPLLARIAGVAKLRLDVVGADKKDELAFLGEAEARALRAELLARAAGFAPETAHEVGEAPARELVRVPARELAIALLLTGATWGALAAALVVLPVLWLATHSVWTVLATGVPLLGAAGASSVGRFVGEYDWTVGESPDGLRIDHGLLDRTHETVPPGRVQTVRIVEPLLWRRRGWVRFQLDAQLARLVEVTLQFGDAFLEAPLVARTRAREVGDLFAGLDVPAAHDDRAEDGRHRGGRGQHAEHEWLSEHPGTEGTDEGDACDRRRRQHPVQRRGMAVTSTWHGQKLTARRRMLAPRPVKHSHNDAFT
ncbi:hypothetical protein SAURM35S_01546 [Streptomyces aurantiogriseus]